MLVMSAPPLGAAFAPSQVRLGLAILLTVIISPIVSAPASLNVLDIVMVVSREAAIGLAMGLAIRALISGAEFAGTLSSYQLGFSYGSLVDPQSGVRNSMFAVLYANLALVTFLGTNGHHALIRALVASYREIPIGGGHIDRSLAGSVTGMLGVIFVLGIRLAMPLVLALLIVEIALGLISRAAPNLNLMAVSQPIRVLVGLMVIATMLSLTPGLVVRYITPSLELGARAAAAFR
jgi:flagellar biosynthetic protein FliR